MAIDTERAAFEEWCCQRWGELSGMMDVRSDGTYITGPVQLAWCAWQAAAKKQAQNDYLVAAWAENSFPWHVGFHNEIGTCIRPTGDCHPGMVRYDVVQICAQDGRHVCWTRLPEHAALIVETVNKMVITNVSGSDFVAKPEALEMQIEALRKDAERYRWLKSRKGLDLRSAPQPNKWTQMDGTVFSATHYLTEGGTQHAPADSLDATIDAAMLVARVCDA